jgi:hypothetical protein
MPCIEYKGKKYTYEEFGAMLKDGGFSRMSKSGELKLKDLGAQVPSSLLDTTRKGIAPETSSNFANLTTDDEGNFVFFHRGDKGFEQIKPGTGQSGRTPANEAAAIGRVGGVAMYYTTPTDSERMVDGDAQYAVTVAPDEVYDFNEDPDNLIDEARERFKSEFPNMAFDANNQLAYVTKIAGERGYKMVVAEWDGRTRAQTTEAMAPSDVSLKEGDRVVKGFDKKYTTNKQKGFEAVIPETKESRFKKLYNEIYKLRNKENRYDELYGLEEQYPKKTQEEITDLIMNSDLSDDIKQRYQEILKSEEDKRRSEKKTAPDKGLSFFEVEDLQEQVDNAKKAMAKLYPELNFVIHDSYDNYNALAQDEEGQESAGFFDAATNTIHINRRAAEDNTVAHETFHAVLFKMFGSDENINKNAKAMLKAIAKEIKSDQKLKEDLENFIANYDENVKNEEKLTELFAQMAAGYAQLNKKERSLVERFLNKLAELLGLRPFKTDEVLDLLNVLSAKITTGEAVTTEDVFEVDGKSKKADATVPKKQTKAQVLNEEELTPLEGAPRTEGATGPDPNLVSVAKKYAEDNNVPFVRQGEYVKVDEAFSKRIADAYEEMKHDPNNPKVKEAYSDLIRQTKAQYDALVDAGYEFTFFDSETDPYNGNPSSAMRDLRANKKMAVYGTYDGYGTEGITDSDLKSNPMLEDTGLVWKDQNGVDKPVTANDLFRAVHDAFGHGLEGAGFRARGEENAWQAHVRLFTGPAVAAITTETRGQNSWLNYGPFGEKNRTAMVEDTVFAEQKTGLMPEWTWTENKAPDFKPKKQIKKQIVGENAKLSQQVRDNLTIARQMESAKKSAKTIRLATGWERGADKKWRYEVPDFKLNELVNKNKYVQVSFKDLIKSALTGGLEQYKLSEVVSGNEIFNAYPFLKNVSLVISNSYKKGFQDVLGKGTQAAYFVDNGVKTIAIKPSPDLRSYKEFFESTIAHEVQHAIQDFEGFSEGGDLNSVKLLAITSIEKKLNKNLEEASKEDVEKLKVTKKEKLLKDFVLNTFYSEEDYKNIDKNALELYNKLYGEVEARNVERRMKMTPEERRQVTLQETEDVSREDQIIFFNKNKKQRPTVTKKIEKALASGMSEAEVVADMVKAGYTEAEAKAYIDQYNAMRSDEYNRVKENIKGITEKVEKRAGKDADPKKVRERKYNDAMNYLQESLWYENASDTERETAVRELRKDLGFSERQAPTAEKVTKGAKDLVTVDSMKLVLQTIKDQNIGAKAALKDLKEKREALRDALKSLVKSGKINTRQAAAMINRVMSVNLNNENAVDKLVKYIEKVYNNAELAEKIYNSNAKRKIALKNIKSKIGGAKEAYPILSKLFAIDARNIPLQALEDFSSLVQQFGERKSVLTTEKIATAIQKAQSVLDKVDEDMSRANELSMIFEAFPDAEKKRDANGDILFDKTIEEMKRQGYIDEATAKEMDEYRSDIYRKERATKEEDAQERKDLIAQISSARIVTSSRLSDPNERAYARELIQMARSKSLLKKLSTNTLRNLNAVMGNIDSGYFPNYGVKVYQAMMIEQKAPLVEDVIKNTSTRLISNAYNSAKSALLNVAGGARTAIGETLRQNMSFDIDFMLGDNKGRRIYESIMEPLAKAYSSYETATTELTEKLEKAVALIEGPILKRSPNEVTKVKFKMMAYLLQKEYESNAGAKGVAPAIDFIKQTIKEIKGKTTMYSQQDADILKSIADEYSVDGQISADAIFNSLSDREKRALAILEDVNKSMTDIAIFTSGVIRGKRSVMFNNYVPHKVLSGVMSKKEELESVKEAYKKINAIGTKAGSLEERMPGAKAIVFDPFTTSLSSANDVLLEYHMAVPMQTTKRILEKVKKDVIEDENSKDVNIDAINAVMAVREEVAQFVFGTAKSTKDDLFSKADKLIMSNSYRALLAGIPKFANELMSNISYVLPQPKNWLTGLKYTFEHADEVMGVELRDIMTLVNSTVTEKVTGRKNVGMISDVGFMGSSNVSHAGKSQGAFKNALETLARNTERPVREIVALIGDKMMSTPDMLVSRPIWVGAMANEFKRQTGVSIDFSRMYDERYRNKYKSAIEAARRVADEEVKMAGSTQNPFDKAAKMSVDTDQSAAKVLAKRMNNFLTNFQMFEFSTARAALYSLVTDGRMSKKKAAAVLAGIELRLIMYSLLGSTITAAFYGLAGYEKDDEEEELTWDKLIRSMTSAQIALLVGRNFGNLTKMGQNYAIEELNKENGQMLRDGEEYNPYKHSVVFNKISEKDIEKKGPVRMASVNLSGPYQNIVETAWKVDDISKNEAKTPRSMSQAKKKAREAVKLEPVLDEVLINTASQAGYLPLARDFRPILKGQYKKKGED